MTSNNSELELEGAVEPGSVISVQAGESVAEALVSLPSQASVRSEGAASTAGSRDILGNKRNIFEMTEMGEEEKRLRDEIIAKERKIEALTNEIAEYVEEVTTITANINKFQKRLDGDPGDNKTLDELNNYKNEKNILRKLITATTENLTPKEVELTKLKERLEDLTKGIRSGKY